MSRGERVGGRGASWSRLLFIALVCVCGCLSPRTEVVIRVVSDMNPEWDGGDIRRVIVQVQRVGEPSPRTVCDLNFGNRRNDLPGDCTLSPSSPSDERRLQVIVSASLRGESRPLERRLIVGFVSGTTQVFEVRLAGRCRSSRGVVCPEGTTCGPTVCEPVEERPCTTPAGQTPDFRVDPNHCGGCNRVCAAPHAIPGCTASICEIRQCDPGYTDLDRDPSNGCEYACVPVGDRDVCDGLDNDCNGVIDDGFNLLNDPMNCGACGHTCELQRAASTCDRGVCRVSMCEAGYVDTDREPGNGCECRLAGEDVCDGLDNDCNGVIDNGVDTRSDVMNCGACGRACTFPNAVPACREGQCALSACAAGFTNRNGDDADGCELACGDPATGRLGEETCNGRDDDCDGLVDEALTRPCYEGPAGTQGVGLCRAGTQTCGAGTWSACVEELRPATEVCDGADNDCDGANDEGLSRFCYTGPLGTVNVGACRPGVQPCQAGAWGACVGEVRPGPEVCDGLDNDCDGAVDDELTPPPALRCNPRGSETQSVCVNTRKVCRGATGWSCAHPPTYRDLNDEGYCDGLDNNCDARVDEGCLTFSSATDVRLDQGRGNSFHPSIAGAGYNLGVVYSDRRSGEADVYFAASFTGGDSWAPDLRADAGTAGSRSSVQPWIAWAGGSAEALIGWSDYRTSFSFEDYRRVFANVFTTTTLSFQASDRQVNAPQTDDSFNVRVAQTPAGAVAVWESLINYTRNRHIYSAFSSDRGLTWRSYQQVDRAPTAAVASTPRVATGAGNRVFVVWRDDRNGMNTDIWLRSSADGGATWGAEVRLDTDGAGTHASEEPSVAADPDGNVYVAWQDVRTGSSYDIYFNRSADHGATWLTTDLRVDTDTFAQDAVRPIALALPGRVAVVVWEDRRLGLPTPYANRGTEAGTRWMPTDVSVPAGRPGQFSAYNLAASASGNLVFVVWADNRTPGGLDIWGNYSLDGGASYQLSDVRFDTTGAGTSNSEVPSVLVTGGRVHVVWLDRRADGVTGDIYYRGMR